MNTKPFRVCFLSVHPAPYRDPILASLALARKIQLQVYILFPEDKGHKEWNYSSPDFPAVAGIPSIRHGNDALHLNIIWRLLVTRNDLVIIPGISRLTARIAALICLLLRKPYSLSVDSVSVGPYSKKSALVRFFSNAFRRSAAAFWVPGVASEQFLASQGIDTSRVYQGMYCLDPRTIPVRSEMRPQTRPLIEQEFSLPAGSVTFLAVGKLLPFRRYDLLISAFRALISDPALGGKLKLLIVGDGPLLKELMGLAGEMLGSSIYFCGPRPFSELSRLYSAADIFVHPGGEPFSTATEYAALAGLPIVAGESVGYISDLIQRGGKPTIFEPNDLAQLLNALRRSVTDLTEAPSIGDQNMIAARARDIAWGVSNFLSMCRAVDGQRNTAQRSLGEVVD